MTTPQLAVFALIAMVFLIINIFALVFHSKMNNNVTPFRPIQTKPPGQPLQQPKRVPQHGNRPLPNPPPKAPFPHAA